MSPRRILPFRNSILTCGQTSPSPTFIVTALSPMPVLCQDLLNICAMSNGDGCLANG
jgi:hypothetical protein